MARGCAPLQASFLFLSLAFRGPGCPRTQLIFITLVCGRCYVTGGETEAQAGSVICPRQHRAPRGSDQGGLWHRPLSGWPQEEQPGPGATSRERLAVPAPPSHAPSRHPPECPCQPSLSSQPHCCPWESGGESGREYGRESGKVQLTSRQNGKD